MRRLFLSAAIAAIAFAAPPSFAHHGGGTSIKTGGSATNRSGGNDVRGYVSGVSPRPEARPTAPARPEARPYDWGRDPTGGRPLEGGIIIGGDARNGDNDDGDGRNDSSRSDWNIGCLFGC